MKTSKVVIFHTHNRPLEFAETAVPALQEGEILVRVEYTTLCRSDVNTYIGKRIEKTPTILGHEVVGRIETLGAGSPESDSRGMALQVGDRITWAIYAAAPDSCYARRGIPQKGPDLFKYGHEPLRQDSTLHGGLAEYCILRKNTPLVKLLKPVPLPLAALINCSVATVSGALRLAGTVRGEHVLITGAGMLGVIACSMCRVNGARTIITLDIDENRLRTARRFGTDYVVYLGQDKSSMRDLLKEINPQTPITRVLDFSGSPEAMEQSLEVLDIGGVAVWVGATFPQRDLQINAEIIVRNLHTIHGLHNYNETDIVSAVEFMENHYKDFPFEELIYNRFNLDQAEDAFRYALENNPYRVGIQIARKEQVSRQDSRQDIRCASDCPL